MCKTVNRIYNFEEKTIKCDSCRGTGETSMNDFSDPYKVTTYSEKCFNCGGEGYIDVASLVIEKCYECEKSSEALEYPLFHLSNEDRDSIKANGFIERICSSCNEIEMQKMLDAWD